MKTETPSKNTPVADNTDLLAILNTASSSGGGLWQRFGGKQRRWWWAGLALLLGVLVLLMAGGKPPAGRFVTEAAEQGNLVVNVSASGTLQPTKSVDVGSELSGTLVSVLAQENDRVSKGQLLAQLDTAKLKDAVAKSRAALAAAEATVAQTEATVAEAKASLARMRQVAELSGGKVPAKTELDSAEASLRRAIANEASARASVAQARAALKSDDTNLAKATIRSPVNGVVLTRKVEPGQTVVAAMSTPVLFVIAEDLTQMELQVKVDEADVANVKIGQPASFTVSAWPGRKFPATIQRVGMGSTTTDNVVTYKTILKVANDDLALRPGMTATASITTASRDNALLVPNAALRFTPPQPAVAAQEGSFVSRLLPRPPPAPRQRSASATAGETQVWVQQGDAPPQAIPLKTGVSNGRYTEVLGGDLKPGMAVITDYQEAGK
jgi:HlyD family secretion protein